MTKIVENAAVVRLWRRTEPRVMHQEGDQRIETYRDVEGVLVYRLIDAKGGLEAEVVSFRQH